jgi:hypothetical protein
MKESVSWSLWKLSMNRPRIGSRIRPIRSSIAPPWTPTTRLSYAATNVIATLGRSTTFMIRLVQSRDSPTLRSSQRHVTERQGNFNPNRKE